MGRKAGNGAVRALDPRYYTDGAVFDRARRDIFFRTWQFAGHVSQVEAPGDYLTFAVLDQELFLVRDRGGALRCFFNVCQHRGHTLVQGTGRTRVLRCPYHAWAYDLDGRLRGAPNAKGVSGFDKESICLTEARLEQVCGFVFVNLDGDAPSLADSYPGVEDGIRELCPDIEERVFVHGHDVVEPCNWLVAVENYNECYHCKVVHPTFASGVVDPKSYNVAAFGPGRCLRHTAKAQSGAAAWYDTSGSDYGSFFLWPAFSLQIYPSGLINTYHWRPRAVGETQIFRGWYARDRVIDDSLQKVIDLDRDTTFAEDLELVREVQRGLSSIGFRPGPLVLDPRQGIDSEHSIATLHQWMRDAVG